MSCNETFEARTEVTRMGTADGRICNASGSIASVHTGHTGYTGHAPMAVFVRVALAVCLVACMLLASACSSSTDAKDIQGEWRVKDSEVTVVFTDTQFKTYGQSFDYTIDTNAKTISFKQGSMDSNDNKYTLSEDKKTLTLDESANLGEEKVTTFEKVSDNVDAEPSVGGKD